MTETESLLSKIRKLQALTTARGATPEEAASAAAKASALLFEHNLMQADVEGLGPENKPDPYGKVEHTHLEANRNTIDWHRSLLYVLAKHNWCYTVYRPNTTTQTVIGKRSNVETVLYLNECVSKQIADMAKAAAKAQLTGKAAYAVSFARGCVATISARLADQQRQSEAQATTASATTSQTKATSNALVIRTSKQELDATVKKLYPHLRKGSSSGIRNHEAYHAGKTAGHGVMMNKAVSRQGQGQLC